MPDSTPSQWPTVSEAVGILNLSERTIRRYIANGKLPTCKVKGKLRVKISGTKPAMPDTPDNLQAEIKHLEAEIKRLKSLLEEVKEDRNHLRQINAALLSNQQLLIKATTTTTETKKPKKWTWPWPRTKTQK